MSQKYADAHEDVKPNEKFNIFHIMLCFLGG